MFFQSFNEEERITLFPFGDWRDLCFSNQIRSNKEVSIKSSYVTINSENKSILNSKFLLSKSNFLENKIEVKHINSNNFVTYQDTEAISSEWKFHKIFKIEKTRGKRSYINRRDVINKSIIRYFYKYLWKLFKQKILNKRYLRTASSLAQRIQDILSSYEDTGESTLDFNRHTINNELSNFIFWIVWKNQSCLNKHFESEQFYENF